LTTRIETTWSSRNEGKDSLVDLNKPLTLWSSRTQTCDQTHCSNFQALKPLTWAALQIVFGHHCAILTTQ
jgi:hypothetical protein